MKHSMRLAMVATFLFLGASCSDDEPSCPDGGAIHTELFTVDLQATGAAACAADAASCDELCRTQAEQANDGHSVVVTSCRRLTAVDAGQDGGGPGVAPSTVTVEVTYKGDGACAS